MRRPVTQLQLAIFWLMLMVAACALHGADAAVNNPPKYFPLTNVYYSTQTVACPPTATWADVQAVAGSGPGGGSSATLGGGGGGAGGLIECLFKCVGGSIGITVGAQAFGTATGGSCSSASSGNNTVVSYGSATCTAVGGGGGIAAGCGGGVAGSTSTLGTPGVKYTNAGNAGAAGSGATPGAGGIGPNPGSSGGLPGQFSPAGLPGYAIVTFF